MATFINLFFIPCIISMASRRNPPITELPPSSKLVYYVLKNNESMTKSQIAAESRLSDQTAINSLKGLEDSNVVVKKDSDTTKHSRKVYCLI